MWDSSLNLFVLTGLRSTDLLSRSISFIDNDKWIMNLEWGLLKPGIKLPKPRPIIEKLEYD